MATLTGRFLRQTEDQHSTLHQSGDQLARVFIGTSADAELEANPAVSQTFIQARDDEKDQQMYALLQRRSWRRRSRWSGRVPECSSPERPRN